MTEPRPSPIPLSGGRVAVPGNRWDLLDGHPGLPVHVAVVIPFYEQHAQLDLTLAALEQQTYPHELLEVIVADDGSAQAPRPQSTLAVSVVSQGRNGFRAAAARNLGARATTADVLCFLDADTHPDPDYVRRIVRLPSVLPDALVVGRRRHAALDGWTPDRWRAWHAGGPAPEVLDEPQWLREAYDRTRALLDVDHTSYRYVISSVMCCSRALFTDIGGFDESFTRYGGEDWELAHRAVCSGAVLQHEPLAVAWHSGPDWAGRDVAERTAAKNHEALAVARLVTDPDARRHGLRYEIPEVAVSVDVTGHTAGSLVATLACFLPLDVGIWLHGPSAEDLRRELRDDDTRISVGDVPAEVTSRCRFVLETRGRAVLAQAGVSNLVATCGEPGVGEVVVENGDVGVVCRSTWALNRTRRWTAEAGADAVAGFYEARRLDAAELGLRQGSPDTSLAW
ncbi:glycosyltransferase [Mycobacterium yunnanensis]|uniref:Glycosyltransferase n=1 Tax=Mycobacterium yunnanensis TaxID=368477 RepID=A0A9X3C3D0_9MYCO|nr:glycosyltransferase [Mycobacterium yunnanensis]MCV7424208.1 glycosyltransferase [Mycobacterium yunnanensis]